VPVDATGSKHATGLSGESDPMTTFSQIGRRSPLFGAGVQDEAGVRVVRLRGELDAFSAPTLRDDLEQEVVARPAVLALDLSDLAFLGVAGLNVLLETQQLADDAGTAMLLVGSPAPLVERLLGLVGWTVTTDPVTRSPR
jgi:anti-anti-sigma factor